MKAYDTVETVMNVLGVGVGVTMIKDILGVALLVINILLLIIRVVVFVVRWYKKASKDGTITDDEIQELIAGMSEAEKYAIELQEEAEDKKNAEETDL